MSLVAIVKVMEFSPWITKNLSMLIAITKILHQKIRHLNSSESRLALILALVVQSACLTAQNENLQFVVPEGHGPTAYNIDFDKSSNGEFLVSYSNERIVFWDYDNAIELYSLNLMQIGNFSGQLFLIEQDTIVYFETFDKAYLWKPYARHLDALTFRRVYNHDDSFIEIRELGERFEVWYFLSHSKKGSLLFNSGGSPFYSQFKFEFNKIIIPYESLENEVKIEIFDIKNLEHFKTISTSVVDKLSYKSASQLDWHFNDYCFDQDFDNLYVQLGLDSVASIDQSSGAIKKTFANGYPEHIWSIQPRKKGLICHGYYQSTYFLDESLELEKIIKSEQWEKRDIIYYEETEELIYSANFSLNALDSNGAIKRFKGHKKVIDGFKLINRDSLLMRNNVGGYTILNFKTGLIKSISLKDNDDEQTYHRIQRRPFKITYARKSDVYTIKVNDSKSDSLILEAKVKNFKPYLEHGSWEFKTRSWEDRPLNVQSLIHWDSKTQQLFLASQRKILVLNRSQELTEYDIPTRQAIVRFDPNVGYDLVEKESLQYFKDTVAFMITKIIGFNSEDSLLLCEGSLRNKLRFGDPQSDWDSWDWDRERVEAPDVVPIILKVSRSHLQWIPTEGLDGVMRKLPEYDDDDRTNNRHREYDEMEVAVGGAEKLIFQKFLNPELAISSNQNGDSLFVWEVNSLRITDSIKLPFQKSYSNYKLKEQYDLTPDLSRLLYLDNGEILVHDRRNHRSVRIAFLEDDNFVAYTHLDSLMFDASQNIDKYVYFREKNRIIGFDQLKDRYYEPGLIQKVLGYSKEPLRKSRGLGSIDMYPSLELRHPDQNVGKLGIYLKNQGGGIGKVSIQINGKEATPDARGSSFDPHRATAVLEYAIKDHPYLIPGGVNQIEVKAYNAEEYLSSRVKKIYYLVDEKKVEYSPSLHAIIIGTSNYSGEALDLNYAAKDALDFAKALEMVSNKYFTEDKVNIQLLSTEETDYSKWPTKENIAKSFASLSKTTHPADVLVVYLSGHGINYGGADGDFYYLTSEASSGELRDPALKESVAISSAEFTEYIKSVPALKQVMIIDACNSGQLAEDIMRARTDRPSSEIRALERLKDRTGMYVLAGSAADAVSYEASIYGQGLLTYSLLFGIKGAALRENKFVDVMDLFQFAANEVPKLAENIGGVQKPEIRVPFGGQSFDIGISDSEIQNKITLPSPKPIFVRSSFQDQDTFNDDLKLSEKLDAELKEFSTARGEEQRLVFIDVSRFDEAYSIKGRYTKSGSSYVVNVRLFRGNELIDKFSVTADQETLPNAVINSLNSLLDR